MVAPMPISKEPIYHGAKPLVYEGYRIGVERLEDMLADLIPLHVAHWEETEKLYLPGEMDPDYQRMIEMERIYALVAVVARSPSNHVVGNLVFHLNYSLHQRGKLIASEDALFIKREHRNGRLAIKMIEYAERILRDIGVHYLTMGDKSPAGGASVERLLERRGYQSVAKCYMKILEN